LKTNVTELGAQVGLELCPFGDVEDKAGDSLRSPVFISNHAHGNHRRDAPAGSGFELEAVYLTQRLFLAIVSLPLSEMAQAEKIKGRSTDKVLGLTLEQFDECLIGIIKFAVGVELEDPRQ